MAQLGVASDQLQKIVQDFRLLLGEGNARGNWREMLQQSAVKKAYDFLLEKLNFTAEVIKLGLGRSQTLDSIFERIAGFQGLLKRLLETEITGYCYWYEVLVAKFGLHINAAHSGG